MGVDRQMYACIKRREKLILTEGVAMRSLKINLL